MKHPALRRSALLLAAAALVVAGCKKPVAPAPSDADLTSSVQQKLAADPGLAGQSIQVAASGGVVTLSGSVNNAAARSLAADDASEINGVKVINNGLTIAAPVAAAPIPAPAPAPAAKPSAAKNAPAPPPQPTPIYKQAPAPIVQNIPAPPPPPVPPKPVLKTYTAAAGSSISVRLTETLNSGTSQNGSAFHGTLSNDIVDSSGNVVYPAGTAVTGEITAVEDAAHFKGSSLLTITLTSLTFKGDRVPIATDAVSKQGQGRGKNTAEKVGGGAVVGAVLGGIFGGGKGAAIGAAAGGGLGAGAQAATKGQEVNLPSETVLQFRLASPLSVTR
jgi:hypothetical protein